MDEKEKERLRSIIDGVAAAHITPDGGNVAILFRSEDVYLMAGKGSVVVDLMVCLKGLPPELADVYLHCRVHELAARLIARLHRL